MENHQFEWVNHHVSCMNGPFSIANCSIWNMIHTIRNQFLPCNHIMVLQILTARKTDLPPPSISVARQLEGIFRNWFEIFLNCTITPYCNCETFFFGTSAFFSRVVQPPAVLYFYLNASKLNQPGVNTNLWVLDLRYTCEQHLWRWE
jgi:hypothetical protein